MKTLEDFLIFRNTVLSKGTKKCGWVFSNEVAEKIYNARPQSIQELSEIPGFPANGKRIEQYGEKIVKWFFESTEFNKKRQ
jgi:hypothetical protein